MLFTTANKSLLSLAPRLAFRNVNNNRTMASLAHKRFQKKQHMVTPDLKVALAMPTSVREMDNPSLITLAAMNDHEASCEVLTRHIMKKDNVKYVKARETFQEMEQYHKEGLSMFLLPFQVGIATAMTAGFVSIPLVFHLPTVHWFNYFFVTTDIPEPRDLETFLEVGAWSWNWMEPPLGQISFFLLCLQFSRAQMENLGIRPYTRHVKLYRVNRLLEKYPQYDTRVMKQYSVTKKLWS